ncbi:MAG: site-specific integrase [Candidatus Hydrogenedentes bacterium]|nr:site-specific integrase [Candidatus Hydrogenedentota bacterium]
MKKMAGFDEKSGEFEGKKRRAATNVKKSAGYARFGQSIRYMTWNEWLRFLDSIDSYPHKLMFRMIYELGCRVGEFVRIQLGDVDFRRGRVFFPRENTKTGQWRTSHFSEGLGNELKSWLKANGRMGIRSEAVKRPREYLFSPRGDWRRRYSENRVRQVFRHYLEKAGMVRVYGRDACGRLLYELTVHSLRHSHVIHFIHIHKLPIAVVQKQVGHTSLKTTSVYLNPSEEAVSEAYRSVRSVDGRATRG